MEDQSETPPTHKEQPQTYLDHIKDPANRTKVMLVGGMTLVLLISAVSYVASQGQPPQPNANEITESLDNPLAKEPEGDVQLCRFPIIEKPEFAVQYGVPEGWIDEFEAETIAIMEDESNTTAAFIYTAKLERSMEATEFLAAVADVFQTIIESSDGQFQLATPTQTANLAQADVTATVAEGDLAGVFESRIEGEFATFTAYWAPSDELLAREKELQEVVECFARTTTLTDAVLASASEAAAANSSTIQPTAAINVPDTNYSGTYFNVFLPSGWTVTGESDSGIDTSNATGTAGFSYAYVTGTSSAIEHASWASQRLAAVGVSGATLGAPTDIPLDVPNYSIKSFPFSGTFGTLAVQGKITVGVYNTPDLGFGSYGSAFWGIQLAESSLWPSVSTTTQHMQDSLFTKDLGATRKSVSLPTGNRIEDVGGDAITSGYEYRTALDDASKDNWAAGMRGYDTYQSPSTGDAYDVPVNAYNPSGPDGAGYYRQLPGGGLEKLEPLE